MKKRGVLSLWKVIMLVIAGIVGVVGVTVLTLYLMGRFEDEFVEPQDMSFVKTIDDGAGYFNDELGQYEVSSNFKLTISSTTENVTEKRITLSLKNGQVKDGYITDGIIKVPQEVTLNKPFEVTLEPEYNVDIFQDWIVGGVSTLTAKSTNVLMSAQTVKIAVDVPVYSIDVSVSDSELTDENQEVVVGTDFTLETKFTPNNSKYLFSDSTREKSVFYAFTSSFISYDWTTGRFSANERSGSNVDTITVYTFANSYYQKQVLDRFADIDDPEVLTSNVLRYFEQNPQTYISKSVNIKVLDVDVDSVEISVAGKTLKTYLDKYFKLTASSINGDGNLGLSIKDSSGLPLNSLFKNVGIKIPKSKIGLKILGGRIVKVVTNEFGVTISQEDFNPAFDYAGAKQNTEYYVLPNTAPKEFSDYYWEFAASLAENYELSVNFFFEDESGAWKNFFNFEAGSLGGEKIFNLLAEEHDYEEDPAWKNNDTINLVINFDENGNPSSKGRNLSEDLNDINENNVYQLIKYFLMVDPSEVGAAENINMQDVFDCRPGVVYKTDYKGQTLTIPGATAPVDGYVLYELDDSVLNALKSFAGKVKVVAATVKTDAENKPYRTADGKYMIVKVSRVKDVMVESTLSIANMTPTFTFAAGITPNAEHDNEYYLPAINRNESASQKTMVTMQLTLRNSEDPETDVDKVINAFNSGNLEVVCLDRNGRRTNSYVTLQGLVQKEISVNEVTFEGTLVIEEGYFAAGKNSIDKGTYIKLQLQYNDGKETYTKDIYQKDDDTNRDHFFIYYQQPIEMKGEFQNQTDLDTDGDGLADTINVNNTATNGINITWGNRVIPGTTTEEILTNLNNLLMFNLTDQFGNPIEASTGIYKIKFVETPAAGTDDYMLSFDSTLSKIQNFASTHGQQKTTTLNVYVVDSDDNFVNIFDADGNVTSQRMTCQDLNFSISSEGISKVEYDNTDKLTDIPNYVPSSDKGTVTIQKYVSTGDVIDLNRLIKVYISGADGNEIETNNFVFRLDNNFISSLSATNKVDIMKMIQFNAVEAVAAADDAAESIEKYRDEEITRMTIVNPFKEDTQIMFTVRDPAQTLYNISLVFVCKADAIISSSFNQYYEKNADYLVQKGNAVGVFAGESYNLDEFIKMDSMTDKNYSWVSALGNLGSLESSQTGVFYESQGICYLSKVDDAGNAGGATNKIMLNINDTYQFKTVNFTLYYGINSFYACSRTFTLYVNPNLVVREKVEKVSDTPFVNLENVSDGTESFATSFQLFKMTDYIENGHNFEGIDSVSSNMTTGNIAFSYENISTDKYVSVVQVGNEFVYQFVNNSTLELSLGEKINQRFNIYAQKIGVDSQPARIDAVKIIDGNDEKEIILCDETIHLSINFNIGYGGDNAEAMAAGVLKRVLDDKTEVNVNVVTYNDRTHVLLLHLSNFNTQDGFSIRDGSTYGNLYKNGKFKLSTYELSSGFVSTEGNAFAAEKTILDQAGNNITLVVSIEAIVSKVGEQFVYYSNDNAPNLAEDMIYNTYKDVDFKALLGSYNELQTNNVYQNLKAGNSYTVVHDSQNPVENVEDAYGFYFNSKTANISGEFADASFRLSIVDEAEGYIKGLASLEKAKADDNLETVLKINHLESSFDDAYIVLKFELYKYQGSVNYTWYYRIKVSPSFSVGNVLYPYVGDGQVGEYLDSNSNYYNTETEEYTIDLEENYTAENSRYQSGKRFSSINWISGEDESLQLQPKYIIKSATSNGLPITSQNYSNFFTYSFDGSVFKFNMLNKTNKLTITLEKSFLLNGVSMIGSEMQYILIFNQGSNYVHSLKQDGVALEAKNNIYQSTISAGSEEVEYVADIKISSNGTESKVNKYNAYISGTESELSGALQNKTYLVKGTNYYDEAGEILGTFENNIFFGDWRKDISTFTKTYFKTKDVSLKDSKVYYVFVDSDYVAVANPTIDDIANYYEEKLPTFESDGNGFISITLDDGITTYKVKQDCIAYTFAYLGQDNILHVKTQDSIAKDNSFEIGYYTDEKVVFRINLIVTSYFNWEINAGTNFKGGNKYNVMAGESMIFSKLEVSPEVAASGISVKNFVMNLSNGDEVYSFKKTLDTVCDVGKVYYALVESQYVVVEEPKDADLKNYYEADLYYKDLIDVTNDNSVAIDGTINWKNSSVEFAHLLKDATFKFTGTITDSNDNPYSFAFEIVAKASFNNSANRRVDDTTARYGGVGFDIEMDSIFARFESEFKAENKTSYTFAVKSTDETGIVVEDTTKTKITEIPENVGDSTLTSKTLVVINKFNDKEMFRLEINYRYTTRPNVEIKANYPMPDGKTEITNEYIATTMASETQPEVQYVSGNYNGFFKSSAMFSEISRIVVNPLGGNEIAEYVVVNAPVKENLSIYYESIDDVYSLTKDKDIIQGKQYFTKTVKSKVANSWNISVGSISNAIIYVSGTASKTIKPDSSDMVILKNESDENVAGLNISFGLINSSGNGTIKFDITVNNVTKEYNVVIVAGDVVKISTNTPNYIDNRETIYAEDLASQPEKELFASDRILSYSFRSNVISGTHYYLRYFNVKTNEVQVISLVANQLGQIVNLDLGKTYSGYEYQGTFLTLVDAEKNNEISKLDDATVYLSLPKLTSRIVMHYYDNTQILLNENVMILLVYGEEGNQTITKANQFTLSKDDFGNVKLLNVSLGLHKDETSASGFEEIISTGGTYNLFLDIEFAVSGNADNENKYTTVEAKAGTSKTLLSYTDFGIHNARTGLNMTAESMSKSSGNITLDIYGFGELEAKENKDNALQNTAGLVDKKLKDTETEDGIKYSTGLSPRAGMATNAGSAGGDLTKNYITLQGVLSNGKTVDYQVFAQGANNDGNHVMMRLTYSVKLGNETIEKAHNILFKVTPNSEIRFKSKHEDAQIYNPSSVTVENNQSVATNEESPYEILNGGENKIFNLWNKKDIANDTASTIVANMYGSSTSSASSFTYTYVVNAKTNYNDFENFNNGNFNNKVDDVGVNVWTSSIVNGKTVYTTNKEASPNSLEFNMPTLALGVRDFYIDLVNDFGYKARFYFKVTSELNPQIFDISNSNITENSQVAFGLRYQTVNPTKSVSGDSVVFDSFEYGISREDSNKYANKIKIVLNDYYIKDGSGSVTENKNYQIMGASISATVKELTMGSEVVSNAVITKNLNTSVEQEITPTNGIIELNIWNNEENGVDKKWYYNNAQIDLKNDVLNGAICVLELKVVRNQSFGADGATTANTSPVGSYTVEYVDGKNPDSHDEYDSNFKYMLSQVHTISSSYQNPVIDGADTSVILTGINAFAYSNSLGAIDENSAKDSKIYDIKVKKVDYYVGETWIGGSLAGEASGKKIESEMTPEGYDSSKYAPLITNTNVSFWSSPYVKTSDTSIVSNKTYYQYYNEKYVEVVSPSKDYLKDYYERKGSGTSSGLAYTASTTDEKQGMQFVVPEISGIYFGTGETLSNVKMNITLASVDGNECVLSQYVNIKRAAKTDSLFKTTVVDNSTVERAGTTGQVFNDTLEVKLQPGGSIQLAISDSEINKKESTTINDAPATILTNKFEEQTIISLTNNKGYAITEYVGISRNIKGLKQNLDKDSVFYINVKEYDGASLWYNGQEIEIPNKEDSYTNSDKEEVNIGFKIDKKIADYSNITLRVENVAELNSSNFKPVTLYFLYKETEVYQQITNFNVYPKYEKGTAGNNNFYQVDNYIKMSNGNDSYYVLTLDDWGSKINLHEYGATSTSGILNTNPHEYYFSINSEDSAGAAGSAFIDENGTITTTTDFDIKYHTLTINVYMKVSGFDGNYEDVNTRLLIGTFRIFLNADATVNDKDVTSGNTYLVGDKEVVSIPAGYTVSATKDVAFGTKISFDTDSKLSFASAVGENIKLPAMFDDYIDFVKTKDTALVEGKQYYVLDKGEYKAVSKPDDKDIGNYFEYTNISNKNYHLVGYTLDGNKTTVNFNNVNSWNFSTAGTYKIEILMMGRQGTAVKQQAFIAEIIVYETSTKEEQQFALAKGSVEKKFDENYSWHLLNEDSTVESVTGFSSQQIGLFTNTYIAQNKDTKSTKIVTMKFFVYSNEVEKSVAIRPLSTFNLQNLVDTSAGSTFDFYTINDRNNTVTKVATESFNYGENTRTTGNYVVVEKQNGGVVSMQKFNVLYKFISANINQESMLVSKDDKINEKAKERIETTLNRPADRYTILLEELADNGILTSVDSEETSATQANAKTNKFDKKYLVSVTDKTAINADPIYFRFNFSFYSYESRKAITFETYANIAFDLSNMNADVVTATGATTGSSVAYYKLSGNSLVKVDSIAVEENVKETYYVKVGEGDSAKFYLIDFTINIK